MKKQVLVVDDDLNICREIKDNPQEEVGHELCIGVYCAGDDETVYYNSYHLKETDKG